MNEARESPVARVCIHVNPFGEGLCINVCWGGKDTSFLDAFNLFLETKLLFGLQVALISLECTKCLRVSKPARPGHLPRKYKVPMILVKT